MEPSHTDRSKTTPWAWSFFAATRCSTFFTDMTTDGGGWTLVLHLYDMTGLSENQWVTAVGHDRFTDADWRYARPGNTTTKLSVPAGPEPLVAQGGIDVGRFTGRWTDVRMGCNVANNNNTATHFVQVDDYTTKNGNFRLLGAAGNGTAYDVVATKNSRNQARVWHDNELDGVDGGHYLCDTTNGGSNGTTQFGFCYTDHLNNDNNLDMGDSIASLSFGSVGGESGDWSTGFTAECGAMGSNALQNTGTFSVWIR